MRRGLTKEQIRSKILARLKIQKEVTRAKKSKIIKDKLFKALVFKKANIVMFYIAFNGEVETKEMIKEAQSLGKIIAVPICKKNRMMHPCMLRAKTKLKKGPYGVYEPAVQRRIDSQDIDLVVVPGIAFDRKGNRLGRGKGYYDRFLKRISKGTVSIGLAFGFQILPSIPLASTDVSVNRVIFA